MGDRYRWIPRIRVGTVISEGSKDCALHRLIKWIVFKALRHLHRDDNDTVSILRPYSSEDHMTHARIQYFLYKFKTRL